MHLFNNSSETLLLAPPTISAHAPPRRQQDHNSVHALNLRVHRALPRVPHVPTTSRSTCTHETTCSAHTTRTTPCNDDHILVHMQRHTRSTSAHAPPTHRQQHQRHCRLHTLTTFCTNISSPSSPVLSRQDPIESYLDYQYMRDLDALNQDHHRVSMGPCASSSPMHLRLVTLPSVKRRRAADTGIHRPPQQERRPATPTRRTQHGQRLSLITPP